MKLKINKACDLSSISVLPPQSRRSGVVSSGLESSSVLGRSLTASQYRTQQPQQSQLTLSQGVSSQHGLLSQFSQNSQEDILTTEKTVSQERENSVRRRSSLPPLNYTREESQIIPSRTSNNLMRKWTSQEYKCQISEELEHRIGMIETLLSRLGMILDSVQSDIMQVNKGTKEVALETEGARQKLIANDDSLQSVRKGQEDIKTCLDMGLKSVSDQLKKIKNQENVGNIIPLLSALSEKIDTQMVKLKNDLHKEFCKEIQAMSCCMKNSKQKQATLSLHTPKAVICQAAPEEVQFPNNVTRYLKAQQRSAALEADMGGWTLVKQEQGPSRIGNHSNRRNQIIVSPKQLDRRIIIDSDEETDRGFSCLLKGKGSDDYSMEKAKEETARILRKARRRKRKYCNTIIIN